MVMSPSVRDCINQTNMASFNQTKDLNIYYDQGPMPTIDLGHRVDEPSEFYKTYRSQFSCRFTCVSFVLLLGCWVFEIAFPFIAGYYVYCIHLRD